MKRLILAAAILALLLAMPVQAFAHHVGNAEDSMPADQWIYVDSVAHGVGADGDADTDIAPGADMATEDMSGDNNWVVTGEANMNAE